MSCHIGQNEIGGCASQKYPGRYFVDRCFVDLIECGDQFGDTTQVVIP